MVLIRLAIYIIVIYWVIRLFRTAKGNSTSSGGNPTKKGDSNSYTDYEELKDE